MENSFKFFKNIECKYFPCHKDVKDFNCLFCYCPLYHLKNCPGTYKMIEKNGRIIKSCVDCSFPHEAENYKEIIKNLHDEMT